MRSDNPLGLRRIINADGRSVRLLLIVHQYPLSIKRIAQYLVHINGQHASIIVKK